MENIKDNKALHTIVGAVVLWFAWRWYFSDVFFQSLYTLNEGEMPLGLQSGSTGVDLGVFGTLFILGLNFVQLVGSMSVAGGFYLYNVLLDSVRGLNVGFLDVFKDKITDLTDGNTQPDQTSEDSPLVKAILKLDENVTELGKRVKKLESPDDKTEE